MRRAAPISEPTLEIARRLQNLLKHAAERLPDFFEHPRAETVLLLVDCASPLARSLGVPDAADGAWIGVAPLGELCAKLRAAASGSVDVGASPERLEDLATDFETPLDAGRVQALAALGGGLWRLKALIKPMAVHRRPNAPGGTA